MTLARIRERRDAGGGLLLVTLDVDEVAAARYVSPGQYVEVSATSERGYFALASGVGHRPWELLVRNAGQAAALLVEQPLGTEVTLSSPLGSGFPRAREPHRPLVVGVVASALGVARPIMNARLAAREAGTSDAPTLLFLGLRAADQVPLAEEVASWSARGAEVVLCLSRAELPQHRELLPGARREEGWVQRVIARAIEGAELPRGALVVAAGPGAMLSDLRELAGLHAGSVEILTNVA